MKRVSWLDTAEVGGVLGIHFFVIACTLLGRAPARLFLRIVALYYALVHATARRASRAWLEKVHGPGRATPRMIYGHLLRFSQVALDRLFLVRRQMSRFDIRLHGEEHLRALRTARSGAILLGAHLGSFEALRVLAEADDVPINILGHFRNARMINAALQRLDPGWTARLIEIEPPKIDFIFTVKDRVDRGEHIAVLGDRVGLGGGVVEVEFMGARAQFPTGVYVLAATLHCPIYLVFALYSEPNRYDVHCELFAEEVVLPRGAKAGAVAEYAQRYAARLSHYGRLAPDNWFNFYDFWADRREA